MLQISQNKFCVFDFYTDWCPNCTAMAPVFEMLPTLPDTKDAFEQNDVELYKVNCAALGDIGEEIGIYAVRPFSLCYP